MLLLCIYSVIVMIFVVFHSILGQVSIDSAMSIIFYCVVTYILLLAFQITLITGSNQLSAAGSHPCLITYFINI